MASTHTLRQIRSPRAVSWLWRGLALAMVGMILGAIGGCGAPPDALEDCGLPLPEAPVDDSPLQGLDVRRSAMACGPGTAQEPPPRTFSKGVDGYASYVGQSICSASAKPGVAAFKDMVLKTYPCTGNYGIVRGCSVGGKSEHKEGRAWDWKLNYPHPAADALIKWLLATDKHGNKHAMARRLGLMYMIWNRKIWRAYRASQGWQRYTGSNPHTDHIHFSFSWDGANKKTSYWSGSDAPSYRLDAKFIGQGSKGTYPKSSGAYFSVCPGQSFSLSFSLQNTGNVEWKDTNKTTAGNAVRLGFRKGERLGLSTRISINSASRKVVKPNEKVTFTLKAQAPTKGGVYRTEWQMVSEMVTWFGPSLWQTLAVTTKPPGYGKSCETGKPGECSAGTMQCNNGKLTCVAKTNAKAEVCDGKDNDCDGKSDEGNPGGGKACETSKPGACKAGVKACVKGKLTCVAKAKSSPEVCDNKDNDCNGKVDDGNPGGGKACETLALGPCKAGVQTCVKGRLSCVAKNKPTPEVCDGKDNDCDGHIDEDGACQSGQEPVAPPTDGGTTTTPPTDNDTTALQDPTTQKGVIVLDDGGSNLVPRPRGGACGCSSLSPSSPPPSLWWLGLAMLGLLGLRRRRV